MQKYTRRCKDCGGGVVSNHATLSVEIPKFEFDEVGRPTQTGVVARKFQGLGTWTCVGAGCKPCCVQTHVSQ